MLAKLKDFANRRPRLAQWIFLAIGMVIILIATSWNVEGLTLGNRAFLIAATIGLAGLCVWIINWDTGDEDEDADETDEKTKKTPAPKS
jgi:hypothetical protein